MPLAPSLERDSFNCGRRGSAVSDRSAVPRRRQCRGQRPRVGRRSRRCRARAHRLRTGRDRREPHARRDAPAPYAQRLALSVAEVRLDRETRFVMRRSLLALVALVLATVSAGAQTTVATAVAPSSTQANPASQRAGDSVSQVSTLAALVAELDRNNPEIKAGRRDVDMRVARIAPAGAPPDPTLSIGYMGGLLRPPFFPSSSTPGSFRQFGLSQEIPFPGKLGLKSRVAATEADAERWNYENTRRRAIAELKMAYVEYQYRESKPRHSPAQQGATRAGSADRGGAVQGWPGASAGCVEGATRNLDGSRATGHVRAGACCPSGTD